MELDARLLITLGGMLISVVSSFVVVRQKVGDLESDLRDVIKKLSALDNRLDRNDTATELTGQRLDVIAGMNSVAERDKLSRAFEKTEVLLPLLDERINRLEHMHNGRHPTVSND